MLLSFSALVSLKVAAAAPAISCPSANHLYATVFGTPSASLTVASSVSPTFATPLMATVPGWFGCGCGVG